MSYNGEEFSRRLERLSDDTLRLISQIESKKALYKAFDLIKTIDSEDELVEKIKEIMKGIKVVRKNFGAKAILYPMPVLIIGTYDAAGNPNAMNAAWGGISEETQISICVDAGHKTAKNVVKTGAFTVSVADAMNVFSCDYVGVVSGNEELNKIKKAGWHVTKSEFVNAPLFDELPLALECKVISYDEETCRLVGEIINVCADEEILDENDKIDLSKFNPITYDPVHHLYRKLGEVAGRAFCEGEKIKKATKNI